MQCRAFVCLSVCLLATLRKNYWTDLREKVTTDVPMNKEELIKFCKSSGIQNILKDLWTL